MNDAISDAMSDATNDAQSAVACTLCGGLAFGPGPGGRMAPDGRPPHCLGCGALERHRAGARVIAALGPDCFDGRRALLVGAEQIVTARRFAACDRIAAPVAGSFALDDAHAPTGGYDFIGAMWLFEYLNDDRRDFLRLARLLAPRGVLQVGFIDAAARPWTSIRSGPRGSLRRLYGRDVLAHFGGHGLQTTVGAAADPCTGVVQQVHFFYRDAARKDA